MKIKLAPGSGGEYQQDAASNTRRREIRAKRITDGSLEEAFFLLQPDNITQSVFSTPAWDSFASSKENTVVRSATEPVTKTMNMLWMDTSAVPNILKRWDGSQWVLTSFDQASIEATANSIASTVVSTVQIGGENFVKNASFGNGVINWSGSGTLIDTAVGLSDTNSCKLLGSVAAVYLLQDVYPVPLPGKNIDLVTSAYVKSVSVVRGATNPLICLRVQYHYTDATFVDYFSEEVMNGTEDWKRLQIVQKTDQTKTISKLRIFLYARDFAGTLYYDDVQVEYGNKATSFGLSMTEYSQILQTANEIVLAVGTVKGGQDSIIPYTQQTWVQGGIDGTGINIAATGRLRLIDYVTVEPLTDYVFKKSSNCETAVYWYNSSNVIVGVNGWITQNEFKINSPATAVKMRISFRKSAAEPVITVAEMPNYQITGSRATRFLSGARYIFDDTSFRIRNVAGTDVLTADTDGNLLVTNLMRVGATPNAGLNGAGTGGTTIRMWAGAATPVTSADFYVRDDGYMKASSGLIGGWSISSTALAKGNLSLSASGTNGTISMGGATLTSNASDTITLTGALLFAGSPGASNGGFNAGTNITTATTRLNYSGYLYAVGLRYGAGGNSSYSDVRMKEDIETLGMFKATDFIMALSPKQFKFIDRAEDKLTYGLVAQEVEAAIKKVGLPPLSLLRVPYEDDEYYGLDYSQFIAPLIAAVQLLNARVQRLEGGFAW